MMKRWTIMLLAFVCAFSLVAAPIATLATEIGDNEAAATEPQVTEPEVTEPEVTEPEMTEPEVTEPEVTEPEVTEPEATEPEVTEPEVTEPEVTEPEVTEPEVTEPEVTEPEVTEPEVTEPEVTEPEVTEPEVTEPEVTEPEETEPGITESDPTIPEKEEFEKPEGDGTAALEGFVQNEDGTWSYYQNGVMVTSAVIEHNGTYYGFNGSGIMYDDTYFSLYNSELGRNVYYRAKAGGALYVNEWYYPYPDSSYEWDRNTRYYYGEGGKSAYGYTEVEGVYYYFEYNGLMSRNNTYTVDGVNYVTDSNGYAYCLNNNGWTQVGEAWYYVVDGVFASGVLEIDGNYYMFSNGKMLTNTSTDFWDETEGRWIYYRAKEDGTLYVNEWYYPYPDSSYEWDRNTRYYYGEGGKAAYGYTEVDGVYYYFDSNGYMSRNSSYTVEGVNYVTDSNGYAYILNDNGWTQIGDEWYYVVDGVAANGALEIDGNYYMFSSGKMLTNTSADFYDETEGRWVYYRAKEDGTLYVNEWYYPNADDTSYGYYYGEGGKAPKGYTEVDGDYYYFNSTGQKRTNYSTTENGVIYATDSYGYAFILNSEGWTQVGEEWYYVVDGVAASGVLEIDGAYYMFYNGKMQTNTSRSFWNEEEGRSVYYRAKEDGTLYVNEWYYPYTDNTSYAFYYGEGGKAPKGYTEVDGAYYYFDYDGQKRTNYSTTENGVIYATDSNGYAYILNSNGWTQAGDDWYYVVDGEVADGVLEIDGAYYMFSNGLMLTNTSNDFWDEEEGRWVYYRAKENGTLYVNEWYYPDPNDTNYSFYYGEGGKAPKGYTEVDGVYYYFDYDGEKLRNRSATVDGVTYVTDSYGYAYILNDNGWTQVGDAWYYVVDGEAAEGVLLINGSYYMFSNGLMQTNTSRGYWDEEEDRSVYYRAKADGKLYVNAWYTDGSNRYYYGEGGKSAYGYTEVDGAYYFFNYNGRMSKNSSHSMDGVCYITDSNGYATKLNNNGWTQVGDKWYYVVEGNLAYGVLLINGNYYMFQNGLMLTNTATDFYDETEGRWIYYRAKANGTLYVNEWYQTGTTWYYYGEGGKAPEGYTNVNGNYYFFGYNGRMQTNTACQGDGVAYLVDKNGHATVLPSNTWVQHNGEWYYAKDGELCYGPIEINGKLYLFDYGRMLTDTSYGIYDDDLGRTVYYRAKEDGTVYVNEWYYPNSNSTKNGYYYGEGGKSAYGVMEIDGKLYSFNRYGQKQVNAAIEYNGAYYVLDADGNMTPMPNNAWTEVNGQWYYIKDGAICKDGVYQIGSNYYMFGSEGYMLTDTCRELYDDEAGRYYYYRAKSDGTLYVNEWCQEDGVWFYYGEGGKAVSGYNEVGGKYYYFLSDGTMATNRAVYVDGKWYIANAGGALQEAQQNGWKQVDGQWYYFQNGEPLHGLQEIGGKLYLMNQGRMTCNETWHIWDSDAGRHYAYCSGPDGVVYQNTWAQPHKAYGDNTWYYFGEGGKGVSGVVNINGVDYLFDDYGALMKNNYRMIDGVWYVSDKNGYAKALADNAWTFFGGEWYYVQNGDLCTGGVYEINGSCYYFQWDGTMLVDEDGYDRYRTKAGGQLYRNEWYWKESAGKWMYYGDDCRYVRSKIEQINGATYYFDYDGYMAVNEIRSYNGETYRFDASGRGTKLSDGWYKHPTTNEWMYVYEGDLANGKMTVNGKTYFFSDGFMQTNLILWPDDENPSYAFGADGVMITKKGWNIVDGSYVYVTDSTGALHVGWLELGGVKYRLDPIMISNRLFTEDGVAYLADKSGACINVSTNGFYEVKLDIYGYYSVDTVYIENGNVVMDCWKKINGSWYYFDEFGQYVSNGVHYIDDLPYLFNENGKLVSAGWHLISGDYYYANASGIAYIGAETINGVQYLFGESGRMLENSYYQDEDGVFYFSDRNGIVKASGTKEGWYSADGYWFYIKQGEVLHGTLAKIGSAYYYFNYDGIMLTNQVQYYDGYQYLLSSSGSAVKGWYKLDGDWYYADPNNCHLYTWGEYTIGGSRYVFEDCVMRVGTFFYNEQRYTTNSSGAVTSAVALSEGYNYLSGGVYLVKDGDLYDGWLDDNYFEYGWMVRDTSRYIDEERYYFDLYGDVVKGRWYETRYGDMVLARADGRLYCDEWYTDGSNRYYFDGIYMLYNCIYWIDDVAYEFDENGICLGVYEKAEVTYADGWKQHNGLWYYGSAGKFVTDMQYINGHWYFFYDDGVMATNAFIGERYYLPSGAMAEYTGWQKINGFWVYFQDDHTYQTGWIQLSGKKYYVLYDEFYQNGKWIAQPRMLANTYQNIDRQLYKFDASGVCQGTVGVENGWYEVKYSSSYSEWYYFENGRLDQGIERKEINGTYYLLVDGLMITDAIYDGYVFDETGRQVTQKGWFEMWGDTIYIGEDGRAYINGVYEINGKIYYFRDYYMVE